jgi:hypothetical protein
MTLFEKIIAIYPELKISDFDILMGSIQLQNDGRGDYIAKWNHPILPRPTEDQLNAA